MYNAEVLSKFPVVQHFPFGSLFSWDRDPDAEPPPPSTHTTSQPMKSMLASSQETNGPVRGENQEETRVPWGMATHLPTPTPQTAAPWARKPPATASIATTRTRAAELLRGSGEQPLRAPWASRRSPASLPMADEETQAPWTGAGSAAPKSDGSANTPTRASRAKQSGFVED